MRQTSRLSILGKQRSTTVRSKPCHPYLTLWYLPAPLSSLQLLNWRAPMFPTD